MMSNLSLFTPFILVCCGGLLVLMIEAFKKKQSQTMSGYVAVFVQLLALLLIWKQVIVFKHEAPVTLFSGAIQIDSFSLFMMALVVLVGMFASLFSIEYLSRRGIHYGEYHSFHLFAVLGMMLMVVSQELVTLFISLELMSMSIYVMCGYTRTEARGIESAIKYFLLGGFAAAVMLFGIVHLYGQVGTTYLPALAKGIRAQQTVAGTPIVHQGLVLLGLGLFFAGLLFKIAAVPFHFWLPDVYEGAPAPVTGFMAAGVKAAAFAVLIKFLYYGFTGDPVVANPENPGVHPPFLFAIKVFACLTMLVPNLIALTQTNIKRILAFSSIAHAGYMLVGVRAMTFHQGIRGDDATAALLFYLMVYGMMTLAAFVIVGILSGKDETRGDLEDFSGYGYKYPFLSAVLAICVLSMAGAPPLAGFWGKYLVFKSAVDLGMIKFAIFAVATSVIAVYYYLRILVHLYMRTPELVDDSDTGTDSNQAPIEIAPVPLHTTVALGLIGFGIIWLGIGPFDLFGVIPGVETFWNWTKFAAYNLTLVSL